MQVGDLVRHRRSESGRLGFIARVGIHGKYFVSWLDGWSSWCVPSMLEVVNEGR